MLISSGRTTVDTRDYFNDFPFLRDPIFPYTPTTTSTTLTWYTIPQELTFTEVDGKYQGYLEMPGYEKSTVKLEVENGVLTVIGSRKRDSKELQVTVNLPKDAGEVTAKFDNGELLVTVEKLNKKILITPQ